MVQLTQYNRNTLITSQGPMIHHPASIHEPEVVIQTCSRLERYSGDGPVDEATARHLFRVVSGLESGLIGETSIQGQIKKAYLTACRQTKLSSSLHQLFQHALRTGKLVRTHTGISRGAMSHSQATVKLLQQNLTSFKNANITILGVHNMNKDLLYHLIRLGASSVFIGNRTYERARDLAKKMGVEAFDFSHLQCRLKNTDVLISATSAPHYLITPQLMPLGKAMLIFDLAVPHDVSPEVAQIPGVRLFNVSEIELAVEQNLQLRQKALSKANAIIDQQVKLLIQDQWSRQNRRRASLATF